MIPARISCPDTWTLEYSGYLMTTHNQSGRTAECVVSDPETVYIHIKVASTNGTLLYHTEANRNGLQCPPLIMVTCVQCALSSESTSY